jgi:hypothetical protein
MRRKNQMKSFIEFLAENFKPIEVTKIVTKGETPTHYDKTEYKSGKKGRAQYGTAVTGRENVAAHNWGKQKDSPEHHKAINAALERNGEHLDHLTQHPAHKHHTASSKSLIWDSSKGKAGVAAKTRVIAHGKEMNTHDFVAADHKTQDDFIKTGGAER